MAEADILYNQAIYAQNNNEHEKAISLLEQGSAHNHICSLFRLAYIYHAEADKLERQNYHKSQELYIKAKVLYEKILDTGATNAIPNYALMLAQGKGIEQNVPKALELLEKGMAINCPHSITNLAELYFNGQIVAKNITKAITLCKKAIKIYNVALNKEREDATPDGPKGEEKPKDKELSNTEKMTEAKKAQLQNYENGFNCTLGILLNIYRNNKSDDIKDDAIKYLIEIDKTKYIKEIYKYSDFEIELLVKIHKLEKENSDMKLHIMSSPDGSLYFEALNDWKSLNTRPNLYI